MKAKVPHMNSVSILWTFIIVVQTYDDQMSRPQGGAGLEPGSGPPLSVGESYPVDTNAWLEKMEENLTDWQAKLIENYTVIGKRCMVGIWNSPTLEGEYRVILLSGLFLLEAFFQSKISIQDKYSGSSNNNSNNFAIP